MPGIQAPYEEPKKPELTIETDRLSVNESVKIIKKLIDEKGAIHLHSIYSVDEMR